MNPFQGFTCLLVLLISLLAPSANATRKLLAPVSENELVHFTVSLPMSDEPGLDQFLQEVYDTTHPNFRKFLTPQEVTQRFGPTNQQVSDVQTLFESNSLKIGSVAGNRFLISAYGETKYVNKFFQIQLAHFLDEESKEIVRSSTSPPVLPSNIRAVFGLDNSTRHRRKSSVKKSFSLKEKRRLKSERRLSNVGLSPSDITSAYEFPTNLQGNTQTIALVEYDNFLDSDITEYIDSFSLPSNPKVSRVYISSYKKTIPCNTSNFQ